MDRNTVVKGGKAISPGHKAAVVAVIIATVLGALFAVYAIVQISVDYSDGNEADDKLDFLHKELTNFTLISNECFTCDTATGDVTFNSTLDVNVAQWSKLVHFSEAQSDAGLTGLTLPGRAFMNSPLSPQNGAPAFLGDVIQAVEAGAQFSQSDVLPAVTAPAGSTVNRQYPNPMSFTRRTPTENYGLIGLGTFVKSETNARCNVMAMSGSPAVYYVIDNDVASLPKYLCMCISDQLSWTTVSGGEYCTTATFDDNFF